MINATNYKDSASSGYLNNTTEVHVLVAGLGKYICKIPGRAWEWLKCFPHKCEGLRPIVSAHAGHSAVPLSSGVEEAVTRGQPVQAAW